MPRAAGRPRDGARGWCASGEVPCGVLAGTKRARRVGIGPIANRLVGCSSGCVSRLPEPMTFTGWGCADLPTAWPHRGWVQQADGVPTARAVLWCGDRLNRPQPASGGRCVVETRKAARAAPWVGASRAMLGVAGDGRRARSSRWRRTPGSPRCRPVPRQRVTLWVVSAKSVPMFQGWLWPLWRSAALERLPARAWLA